MSIRIASAFLLAFLLLSSRSGALEVTLPQHERVELPNGTVLILSEKHDVPLVGLEAIVRGGAITDPEGLNGLSGLLARVMQHGAGERDAAAFAEAIESVGGELDASADLEALRVSADFMSRDAELMIELVADMLQRPALAEEELEKLRDRSINLIKAAKGGNPGQLLPAYGNAYLFGAHPYGNPVGGSEATLGTITHKDLLAYYEDFVGGDRLIISVVGDFNLVAMKARLDGGLRRMARCSGTATNAHGGQQDHRAQGPADRRTGCHADVFLDRQSRCRRRLSGPRGTQPGEHGLRRSLHVNAQHRAARQGGPDL